jgi:hypothetical protein
MSDITTHTCEQPAAFEVIPPREMADVRGGEYGLSGGETYRKRPSHDSHIELAYVNWGVSNDG